MPWPWMRPSPDPEFVADLIAKVAEGGSEHFQQVQFPSLPVSFFAGDTEEDDQPG